MRKRIHGWGGRCRAEVRSKVYTYHTAVKRTEQRKGVISCAGKPDIQVATPPEFKGHEGIWSPEDVFVASANICVMTKFLAVAERAGRAFTSYESVAEGRLELADGKFQFTVIMLTPTITLKDDRVTDVRYESVPERLGAENHCEEIFARCSQ